MAMARGDSRLHGQLWVDSRDQQLPRAHPVGSLKGPLLWIILSLGCRDTHNLCKLQSCTASLWEVAPCKARAHRQIALKID